MSPAAGTSSPAERDARWTIEARCPDHPKLAARGTCVRCGQFICEACDPLEGRHCTSCRERAARKAAAAPWKGRQSRAAIALGLSVASLAIAFAFKFQLDQGNGYLLTLNFAMCFGLVAAAWSAIAWFGSRNAASPERRGWFSVPIAGCGCLLAFVAALAIFIAGAASWA